MVGHDEQKDGDKVTENHGFRPEAKQMIFKAGQSKRIWGELYKVRIRLLTYACISIIVCTHHCYNNK